MSPDRLWSSVESAERKVIAGQYDSALQEIESVHKELEEAGRAEIQLVSAAHYVRGLCRTELGELDGAIADLERATGLDARDSDPTAYLLSAEALAAAYDYAERYSDAERLFRSLITKTSEVRGSGSREHGRALAHLGINLGFQNRCGDATPMLKQAIEVLARVAPHETALDGAWNALGTCAYTEGRPQEALGHFERAFALRERVLGPDHPRVAIVRHNLARVLADLKRKDEALPHARAAVRVRQALPADHPWRRESEALYRELGGTLPVPSQ